MRYGGRFGCLQSVMLKACETMRSRGFLSDEISARPEIMGAPTQGPADN